MPPKKYRNNMYNLPQFSTKKKPYIIEEEEQYSSDSSQDFLLADLVAPIQTKVDQSDKKVSIDTLSESSTDSDAPLADLVQKKSVVNLDPQIFGQSCDLRLKIPVVVHNDILLPRKSNKDKQSSEEEEQYSSDSSQDFLLADLVAPIQTKVDQSDKKVSIDTLSESSTDSDTPLADLVQKKSVVNLDPQIFGQSCDLRLKIPVVVLNDILLPRKSNKGKQSSEEEEQYSSDSSQDIVSADLAAPIQSMVCQSDNTLIIDKLSHSSTKSNAPFAYSDEKKSVINGDSQILVPSCDLSLKRPVVVLSDVCVGKDIYREIFIPKS